MGPGGFARPHPIFGYMVAGGCWLNGPLVALLGAVGWLVTFSDGLGKWLEVGVAGVLRFWPLSAERR
jgi:hypothetical protein